MFAFVDAGRVWVKNDNVSKMATGYGAGLWFSPLRRIVFALSYGLSKEDHVPLFGMSWKF
jgi:outer membrane translocation and assembly module TamA